MYVVIDRNTSAVVHKGTLFMNEGEHLDIDISGLFSERNESRSEENDIDISESLYVRPLFRVRGNSMDLEYQILDISEERDVKMLLDICNTRFEFFPEICGSFERDIICVGKEFLLYCLFTAGEVIVDLDNLELLKQLLDVKINTKFSFQDLQSITNSYGDSYDTEFNNFVMDYGNADKMDLLVYMICTFHSIHWNEKELIKFLKDSYTGSRYSQIFFDAAVYNRYDSLVQEYVFKVELNPGNIRKLTEMAYCRGVVGIVKLLLINSDKLKGDLDENALKTAIKTKNYELVQEIISKYPNTMSVSCLGKAIEIGDTRIIKQLIEGGVNLKSLEYKEVRITYGYSYLYNLRLWGGSNDLDESEVQHIIGKLCSIKNYDIAKRLLEISNLSDEKTKSKTSESLAKTGTRLRFSKTIICLIKACQDFRCQFVHNGVDFDISFKYLDLFENVIAIVNSRRKKTFEIIYSYFQKFFSYNHMVEERKSCYEELLEIIRYIIENNLQNPFEYTEHDEINEFGYKVNIEVLNDRHYELAKSELVNRNFEILKLLIEYGVDINTKNSLILRTAYKAGDIGWIDYFIGKGAKLNGESDGFEEACKSDKVEVLEHWIKNGGVVPNNPKYECINVACILGNFDMIKWLVENGVDLSNPELNGVRVACRLGLKRTLKYLLDNNAEAGNICRYQLDYARLTEDIEMIKMILEYYVGLGVLEKKDNTNTKEGELQHYSPLSHNNSGCFDEYKITKILLEKGMSMDNSDLLYGIKAAITVSNIELLNLLLTYKINPNHHSKIMEFAVQLENVEAVKLLLESGISVEGNTSILDIALESKNAEMFRLLLENGAKVESGSHKLYYYFDLDDIETIQLMLNYCPEIGGFSRLLESAIEKNKLEAAKLLLKDTTTLENNELDFVYYACRNNNLEFLKLLFENGVKIKRGSGSGVVWACTNNNLEMLKLLLERNPNLVLKKEYGLKEAIKHKNVEIIKLLIKHGIDTSRHIELIIKVANELDDQELVEFCQYTVGGFKKAKQS